MQSLTSQGQQIVSELAQRYACSTDAVMTLLRAVAQGNGTMAQFNHPELGGGGQWMQGGMTMVGDMFNNALKGKVDGLCSELSRHLASQPLWAPPPPQSQSQQQGGGVSLFVPDSGSGSWWPAELGSPSATGSQNNIRYAVFPASRRLAIDLGGQVTVYDTLDHQIGGVSQQQGWGASLTFSSQYGLVRIDDLPVVSGGGGHWAPAAPQPTAPPASEPSAHAPPGAADVFGAIERLAELRQKGMLTDEEFASKKAELLGRL
jgi:hypothetical protein